MPRDETEGQADLGPPGSDGDRLDQSRTTAPADETEPVVAPDASEGDALDQARLANPVASFRPPRIPDDVPEADALDQAREVLLDEDELFDEEDS